MKKWKFAIDRGGTFTDVVAVDPEGRFHTLKLLSESSEYGDASIEGIRRILSLKRGERLPGERIEGIRFGTTIATNALLERKGGRVGLLITKGFADLLAIGYQNRPDIFKLCIEKPMPLYSSVFEIDERIDCYGRVVRGIDKEGLSEEIGRMKAEALDGVAVVFMHSWINPEHEILCGEILREKCISRVFLSHRTVNQIKIVSRGQSSVVDGYLSTVLAQYLQDIQAEIGSIPIEFMLNNGTLAGAESFAGKNALLSGPAGGVIAVSNIAEDRGYRFAIGFDMGGTSTDVSRFDGRHERIFEKEIAGIPLQIEMLSINTVAAGGGSILSFDGRKMLVGPESAGSDPGPACYGFGGPLTVTDANLMTGRLIPEYFPKTFGADRRSSADADIAENNFRILTEEINKTTGSSFSPQDIANGFLKVANEKMAMAIREISVSRGFDVRDYTLVCFGGAGGQHACDIASLLDMDSILIHPLCSVLSAYGIGLAHPARKVSRTFLMPFTESNVGRLDRLFVEMENGVSFKKGPLVDSCTFRREIDLRPRGTETFLTLEYGTFDQIRTVFNARYESLYGFLPDDTALEVVNVRVEIAEPAKFFGPYIDARPTGINGPISQREIYFENCKSISVPVYHWQRLSAFFSLRGPACIVDDKTTIIVNPDFEASLDEKGVLMMKRLKSKKTRKVSKCSNKPDPILLEVFNNLFMGVAREMGSALGNTAYSVNMKERLDFSCAVFDAAGNLVANAPHIPVHLGAMSDTVKSVLEDNRSSMKPGDLYLSNNPYRGGSHLPDLTVVCPVFSERGEIIFFTANRGHHADIGGTTPGSMPPESSHIDEEGIVIDGLLLVREGVFREDTLKSVLADHPYPARNIRERIGDVKAQVAACHKGMVEIYRVIDRYGMDTVMDYMRFILDNAELAIRDALYGFLQGRSEFKA
ncbi:MAG: hydantoinase/oxoprolinase family protein, partial [Nitrospirota bacterium]